MYYKHEKLLERLFGFYLYHHSPQFVHPSWHKDLTIPNSLWEEYKKQIEALGLGEWSPELINKLSLKYMTDKEEYLGGI